MKDWASYIGVKERSCEKRFLEHFRKIKRVDFLLLIIFKFVVGWDLVIAVPEKSGVAAACFLPFSLCIYYNCVRRNLSQLRP